MEIRNVMSNATEKVKRFFGKNNKFFYGTQSHPDGAYEPEGNQGSYAQPDMGQQGYPQYGQDLYQAQAYPGQEQGGYQPYQAYPQGQGQQPYQGPTAQQGFTGPYAPQNATQQHGFVPPPQEPGYQAFQSPMQGGSPQQAQLNQAPQEGGRNRRAAQHQAQQPQQAADNLVPFPGANTGETESKMVDAYVVNITNITGCRQAMTCLRKGNCTLVVMDQLIDKAEVRRYVDMLNGACFALGGTMTRLSSKVGFYILAPAGMMVYTDPITASANAPAGSRPAMPGQGAGQPMYQTQQPAPQQPMYQPQQGMPMMPPQQNAQPQGQYAAPQHNPYAPPQPPRYQQPQQAAYQEMNYQQERYA